MVIKSIKLFLLPKYKSYIHTCIKLHAYLHIFCLLADEKKENSFYSKEALVSNALFTQRWGGYLEDRRGRLGFISLRQDRGEEERPVGLGRRLGSEISSPYQLIDYDSTTEDIQPRLQLV